MKDMGQGDSRGKALALLLALVPLLVAATMGMAPILAAKKCLLLACFQEQTAPLKAIFAKGAPTPFLPASYLWRHPDYHLINTTDKIAL